MIIKIQRPLGGDTEPTYLLYVEASLDSAGLLHLGDLVPDPGW